MASTPYNEDLESFLSDDDLPNWASEYSSNRKLGSEPYNIIPFDEFETTPLNHLTVPEIAVSEGRNAGICRKFEKSFVKDSLFLDWFPLSCSFSSLTP